MEKKKGMNEIIPPNTLEITKEKQRLNSGKITNVWAKTVEEDSAKKKNKLKQVGI